MEKQINAIFWLMKDPCVPPILKINDPVLASAMGAVLATKRTSAERLAIGVDPNALVFEPYANPFRTYPLQNDYLKFKSLFERGVDCYILNTGHFMDEKVTPKTTLSILEALAEKNKGSYKKLFSLEEFDFFTGDMKLPEENTWRASFKSQIASRIEYIKSLDDRNKLPQEVLFGLEKVFTKL